MDDYMVSKAPVDDGPVNLSFLDEMMFYQYLPVALRECDTGVRFYEGIRLEPRLEGLRPLLERCWWLGSLFINSFNPEVYYCYLTAKVGWATPGNPLNRPGWHVDAWGIPEDISFVVSDAFPTRYIEGAVSGDMYTDRAALETFERAGRFNEDAGLVKYCKPNMLYVFGQDNVHATAEITEPGLRRFVKINLSPHKYNLGGNSKNHLLVYNWPMVPREVVRNHPEQNNGDFLEV